MASRHRAVRSRRPSVEVAIPVRRGPRPAGIADAWTRIEHLVTDEEFAAHRHFGSVSSCLWGVGARSEPGGAGSWAVRGLCRGGQPVSGERDRVIAHGRSSLGGGPATLVVVHDCGGAWIFHGPEGRVGGAAAEGGDGQVVQGGPGPLDDRPSL